MRGHLVLERKLKQHINIGDDIEVCILRITSKAVKLGIRAPSSVAVHRSEVYKRIQEQKDASKAE